MKTEYENVRKWLLQAERYEDVAKFDNSDEDREQFYKERGNFRHHHNMVMTEMKIPKEREEQNTYNPNADKIEMMQKRIDHLEEIIKTKNDIIEDRGALILILKERLRRASRL